ncbi:hypothetical protein [Fodinibius halophilus]|uniref:STAS domain-containing protein n=1 Tax=Fodinibius halophilus TaxID=1736908 RepID=A0A6M1T3Z4_9BACT|nr:hypothetical protein [Fodinibius halophilus]NGP88809.1 hypothetical protein [Fodinibius halophilus]
MNIVNTHKDGTTIQVRDCKTFNLQTKNVLKSRLTDKITKLYIDFSHCKLIDSEGIIFLYEWQHSGNELELKNPPEIMFEILNILELDDTWDLNYFITEDN